MSIATFVLVLTVFGNNSVTNQVVSNPSSREACTQYSTSHEPSLKNGYGSYHCVPTGIVKNVDGSDSVPTEESKINVLIDYQILPYKTIK